MMRIKIKEMPLILAILQDPTATQQELSDIVATFADHTWDISNISRKLSRFFDPKNGIMYEVQPVFNLNLLHLELHGFIIQIEDSEWERNVAIVEKLIKLHPYAIYTSTVYGRYNGLYVQFHNPKKSDVCLYVSKLLDYLQEKKVVKGYQWMPDLQHIIDSNGSLGVWDPWTSYWDVDFEQLKKLLDGSYDKIWMPRKNNILKKLRDYDLAILRELSKGLKRSQKEVMLSLLGKKIEEDGYDPYLQFRDSFPKSKQSLSRRISWIEDFGFIKSKWLVFDRERFGLFNQVLFIFDRDESGLHALKKAVETEIDRIGYSTKGSYTMKNKVLPYPCAINANENKIVLWLNLQPVDLLKFADIFTKKFSNVEMYFLGGDPKSYFFNNFNFDSAKSSWKVDRVYVYDSILYLLKNELEEQIEVVV